MEKPTVALFGSSGTMGIKAFEELWKRRDKFNISILVRPSKKNKKIFRSYEKIVGMKPIPSTGMSEKNGFKIVWGDVTIYEDVKETIRHVDWVLSCLALISPTADYCQEEAHAVNTEGIRNIIDAIESEPNGSERIKYIHTSSVALTGDRMGPVRWGRIGDPVFPSIYDYYSVTKIAGERLVLESSIKHWAVLRLTFIMPTNFAKVYSLLDPILFHMPLDTCMENTTDRDAGYGIVNSLEIPNDSDFWRRVYNFGGGPEMQCTGYEYVNLSMGINGMSNIEAIMDRKWFALRNFHLQLYEDSSVLNDYLHFRRDTLETWKESIIKDMPGALRLVRWLALKIPAIQRLMDKVARKMMKNLAENHRNGTRYWFNHGNEKRIVAFFIDYEIYEAIPGWDIERQWETVRNMEKRKVDHGYDEGKTHLDLTDLQKAAEFRGGKILSTAWNGDMFKTLEWECCLLHKFTGKPNTVLKAGHWCPECAHPPWRHNEIAKKNPFFAQIWYVMHDKEEEDVYTLAECQDIENAHLD
ncbi:MAG: NAD-dependent epimerase/dehydratase family protein [Promethearchaeota archaeon]|nr:MAG: NAD-dependent epimerase/dehydratase family protein [Candidatus Lokiarchaeota archaeon]